MCVRQQTDPEALFLKAADGDLAHVRTSPHLFHRLSQPDAEPESIIRPHRRCTLQRMQAQQTVILVQDGTDLHFAQRRYSFALGLIRKNDSKVGAHGLHMHATLAVNGDGIPLGVPRIEFREANASKRRPLPERETGRYVRGLQDCMDMAGELDGIRPLLVMDRQEDLFALFGKHQRPGAVDLLIRAKNQRSLGAGARKLVNEVRAATAQGVSSIRVHRRSARKAKVELRWRSVRLVPAVPQRGRESVSLSMVHVRGAVRLEWFLLTTLEVRTEQDARKVAEWYRRCWRMKEWLRILKMGCSGDYLSLGPWGFTERSVTVIGVVSWRLTAMMLLLQEAPDLPAEVLYRESELAILRAFSRKRRLPAASTLGNAVRAMAGMGGYLNRRTDPLPGPQLIWRGYVRLSWAVQNGDGDLRLE